MLIKKKDILIVYENMIQVYANCRGLNNSVTLIELALLMIDGIN